MRVGLLLVVNPFFKRTNAPGRVKEMSCSSNLDIKSGIWPSIRNRIPKRNRPMVQRPLKNEIWEDKRSRKTKSYSQSMVRPESGARGWVSVERANEGFRL